MAEARFEQYHVPQQSRRDKLRVNHLGILDPADFIGSGLRCIPNRSPADTKEDVSVSEFIGYGVHGMNMMPSPANCLYADPPINPPQIQDITPFLYNPFHGGGGGSEMMVYRPPEQVCGGDRNPNSNSNGGQGRLSLSLDLRRNDSGMFPASGSGEMEPRSLVPMGPFTGYASVLKGSRFLKPAQVLLGELCDVGRDIYVEKFNVGSDSILLDPVPSLESFSGDDVDDSKKKSRLMSMLHEVHRRYKQYYQQMQLVMASFESVAGVRNAAPFACLALKSMSKNFRCLKNAITDQLQMTIEPRGHVIVSNDQDSTPGSDTPRSSGMHFSSPPQITGYMDQPVWRPQRGLPERAVTVLRSWLFDHFLHPYPTDTDKLMLAKQTGLSRNQVSNWFINARVRLWKPMVEEIHMLETRQEGEKQQKDDPITGNDNGHGHGQGQNGHFPASPGVITAPENDAATPRKKSRELRQKRSRDESNMDMNMNMNMNMNMIPSGNVIDNVSYENSFHPGNGGFGVSAAAGNGGGVSLTLGLYQNHNLGLGLPEPYPMNAARRFGLDGSGAGGFSGSVIHQNRHAFGREIMGGQLLHDFVG